jgi:methionine aminopeptidase
MIVLKTAEEIELMRESALIVSKTLGLIAKEIKPGVTTLYLDKLAEEFIRDNGAEPAFLGMYGFPNTLCMSPNTQVVHGIPNNTPLQDGDIISVDCGSFKNGFYGDCCKLPKNHYMLALKKPKWVTELKILVLPSNNTPKVLVMELCVNFVDTV